MLFGISICYTVSSCSFKSEVCFNTIIWLKLNLCNLCINLLLFVIREESINPILLPLIWLAHRNENDSILSEQVNSMNSQKNKVQYALRLRCVEVLRSIEKFRTSGISSVGIT